MDNVEAKKWKSSQLMKGNSYDVNIYRDKDFKTVEMHSHDFYELYFFIRGSASYIVENGHYSLQSGDVLLISPNNLHQLDIKDSSATYERIVLWLNPRYAHRLSTAKTNLLLCFSEAVRKGAYLVRNQAVSESVLADLTALCDISSSTSFGSDILAENHIKSLLITLANYCVAPTSAPLKRADQNKVVAAAVDYINGHIADDLSLDTIAEKLFVSKYYLAHLFKEETNTPPHTYILKKRLTLSKRLIEQGLPITETAVRCGFPDYTGFFRAFKNEYGITPKQYYSLITGN